MKTIILTMDELFRSMEQIEIKETDLGGPPHCHQFFELVLFLAEGGMHYVNNVGYPVNRGDIWLLPPDVEHYYEDGVVPGETGVGVPVLNCICSDNLIQDFFAEVAQGDFVFEAYFDIRKNMLKEPIFIRGDMIGNVVDDFYVLQEELHAKQEGYLVSSKSYLKLIVLKLLRLKVSEIMDEKHALPASDRLRLAQIVEYIKENYHEKISTKDLCEKFFFSEASLRSKFKLYTKMTLIEFVQNERIKNACRLLRDTNLTIEEIASEVGFLDKKGFYILFEREKGCKPKAYRDSMKN